MASDWTFLSNYGHVLIALAQDPGARMRDVAERVGITERAVQQIVGELVDQGYVEKVKVGRRNQYWLHPGTNFRHPLEAGVSIEAFVALVVTHGETPGGRPAQRGAAEVSVPGV